ADKSFGVFSEGGPADETEHERREPSRVEKGSEHPPRGISAAQVFIHHVPGDFHPMLRADVVVIFGTGGRPRPRANSVRRDAGIFSGSSPKYEMAFIIAPLTAGSIVAQMN